MTSSGEPRKILPTPRLKDYDTSVQLGAGAYGTVYQGRKKSGARDVVAVKCILKSRLSSAEADNLITEISMLKKMKHDHIVEMKDFGYDANYIYIVMEYCGGGDLSRFIRTRQSLSEPVCRRFLQQLALALRYLRSHDVAHMDLKPSNILLSHVSKRPTLKLADFGFATKFSSDECKTAVRGSPLYMAPEMVLHRKYDVKADLWSVGVILYECLFGRAPYKSSSVEELITKIREGHPIVIPDSPKVSSECKDLLKSCLQRDPAERISFEDFFNHPFLDLEHMPSDDSLAKALSLCEEAVREDNEGNLAKALELYKSALDYYVPLVHYEKNPAKKEVLRQKVGQYITRAETLKGQLNPRDQHKKIKSKLQQRSSTEVSLFDELFSLSSGTPRLVTGLEIARDAESYELQSSFSIALEKYEMALGILIPVLSLEPSGRRKKLLHGEVEKWMAKAETIKELLSIQEKVLSQQDLADPVGNLQDKTCAIQ